MSYFEMKYLLVPAGTTSMVDSLEEESARLRAEGFEFTGNIEEIRTVLFFKLEFMKQLKENEHDKIV